MNMSVRSVSCCGLGCLLHAPETIIELRRINFDNLLKLKSAFRPFLFLHEETSQLLCAIILQLL